MAFSYGGFFWCCLERESYASVIGLEGPGRKHSLHMLFVCVSLRKIMFLASAGIPFEYEKTPCLVCTFCCGGLGRGLDIVRVSN